MLLVKNIRIKTNLTNIVALLVFLWHKVIMYEETHVQIKIGLGTLLGIISESLLHGC